MNKEKLDLSSLNIQTIFSDADPIENTDSSSINDEVEVENEKSQEKENSNNSTSGQNDQAADTNPSEGKKENDKEEGKNDDKTIFHALNERLGYEVEGEFDEDYDGLANYTKKIAEKMVEAQFSDLFKALPDVEEYMAFRLNGGNPKEFFAANETTTDFSSLDITEDNTKAQELVIATLLKAQGFSQDEIQETIEDYKDTNILFKQAKKALPKVVQMDTAKKEQLLSQQAAQKEAQDKQAREKWEAIKSTIGTGSIKGFIIPEKEKSEFYNWMSVPVEASGKSQRTLDREKMDTETMLAMEYLFYKKFELGKLAQNVKNTNQANNLRSKLNNSNQGASARMNQGGQSSSLGVKLPRLNEII